MTKPRIVLCGVHEQGLDIARHLMDHDLAIAQFVTLDQPTADRAHASGWIDYTSAAHALAIPVYHAKTYSLKHPDDLAFFNAQQFDIMIFGGWQRLVPANVLASLTKACIGQHGSPEFLPRGRGRSPINWSIIQGRDRIIWQLFEVTPGIDDGPILDFASFDINPWDDCRSVYYKVAVVMKRMLVRTIPRMLDGSVIRRPQTGLASYYEKRTPADGLIDWLSPVESVHNLVRAVTRPYPGAFTYLGERRVNIWKAVPWDRQILYPDARPGEVVEVFESSDHVVNGVDGTLLISDFDGPAPKVGDLYSQGDRICA